MLRGDDMVCAGRRDSAEHSNSAHSGAWPDPRKGKGRIAHGPQPPGALQTTGFSIPALARVTDGMRRQPVSNSHHTGLYPWACPHARAG